MFMWYVTYLGSAMFNAGLNKFFCIGFVVLQIVFTCDMVVLFCICLYLHVTDTKMCFPLSNLCISEIVFCVKVLKGSSHCSVAVRHNVDADCTDVSVTVIA